MKKNLLFLTLLIFISCVKDEDDSDEICLSDCTQIRGQLLRADGKGVEGLELIFRYQSIQELSVRKRTIGRIRTDENGFYEMNVYLKDHEVGDSHGYFLFELSFSELDMKLSNNFLKPTDLFLHSEYDSFLISDITERSETFEINYFVPYKSNNLNISLNNFSPSQEDDYFFYNLYVPYGFPENYAGTIQEQRYAVETNNTYSSLNIIGVNKIVVVRRKNGNLQEKIEQDINVLNIDDNYEVEFEY
ncbi:hypothetical protein EYD45_14475 [Hyunsoonleella flava]|uniref:Uncharacterized protein n=1 Tax=Hyunsoonleella flava TaxID=2527939 RepID=A0A4Q9FC15_9FLAO|nr:hypothetical protein [Hyunsoonleella flava]TBN00468.1 hypothetical protein EYD45_14475 [Hyunsoonleella flava]